MLKNYFKIAFRNIIRHRAYSFLNISGLAIGMACSILILLWVQNEFSYDREHPNKERLFRLTTAVDNFNVAVSPAGMAEGLKADIPEIAATLRISATRKRLFEYEGKKFEEKLVYYADSNFLDVFAFPLVAGDATVLDQPDGVLMTQKMASKYFGNEDPIGKTLRVDNQDNMIVKGVISDKAPNSHLQFDFILPMSALARKDHDLKTKTWGNFNFYTYILLDRNVQLSDQYIGLLNRKIDRVYAQHKPEGMKPNFHLQSVSDIHLKSDLQIDIAGRGNLQYVRIFFVVALFILAVACINFMNLATARSARRSKEVGLRKVVGAGRGELIVQFLGESLVIAFVSIIIALAMVWSLIPAFNSLSGKNLTLDLLDGNLILILSAIALVTGLVSGSYPAIFLSGFKPISVLKGKLKTGSGDLIFRNGLVVTQFVVSIILLAGTAVVYKQLNFMQNRNLGFEKENLLYMPMTGEMWSKTDALESSLRNNRLTSNYTIVSDLPTNLTTGSTDVQWQGKDPGSHPVIPSIDVDENFIDVFKMKLLSGRGFSSEFKGDSLNIVVNETSVKLMGMTVENAVGKAVTWNDENCVIIGVVKDFNFKPFQYAIEPLFLRFNKWGSGIAVIKTNPSSTEETINELGKISAQLNPSYPFSFNFLDRDLDNLYQGEQQMGKIFNLFALLAIFISCLGLYGLSAFMAEQRTREIGVRKVLGASVSSIVYLLSGKFTKLIFIAILITTPISWFAVENWLEGFAYRIEISWTIFLMSALASLFIAWLTVSYESAKAAIMNPVKSLRSE